MTDIKRPAFLIFPTEAEKEKGIHGVSLGARGLMLELLMVMHSCEPYGHLAVAGRALTDAEAAMLTCTTLEQYQRFQPELLTIGVLSRTVDGILYSPRMVANQ